MGQRWKKAVGNKGPQSTAATISPAPSSSSGHQDLSTTTTSWDKKEYREPYKTWVAEDGEVWKVLILDEYE
ncbi:hypothetical protein HK102_000941 [Quaeritorhiza haematococci]|nr:hypothetical protein HK102_000941 [Quaeritorhiza haematococci]